MVVATDHVGDAHVEIVDDDAEVVRGRAVGAGNDEIVEFIVGDLDPPFHRIVPGDDAADRIAEPHDRWDIGGRRRQRLAGLRPPALVITRLLTARLLRGAHRIEFGR